MKRFVIGLCKLMYWFVIFILGTMLVQPRPLQELTAELQSDFERLFRCFTVLFEMIKYYLQNVRILSHIL